MKKAKFLIPVLFLLFSSCAGIKFNETAQAQNQRVHSLTQDVIDQSVNDYSANTALIQSLNDSYNAAISFEESRGKTNYPTISMWKQVHSWVNVDFMNLWKAQGKIGKEAAYESKLRVDKLFDHIINLENNKIIK